MSHCLHVCHNPGSPSASLQEARGTSPALGPVSVPRPHAELVAARPLGRGEQTEHRGEAHGPFGESGQSWEQAGAADWVTE